MSLTIKILVSGLAVLSTELPSSPSEDYEAIVEMPKVESTDWAERRIHIPDHHAFLVFALDQWKKDGEKIDRCWCDGYTVLYGKTICWRRIEDYSVILDYDENKWESVQPKKVNTELPFLHGDMPKENDEQALQAIDWVPTVSEALGFTAATGAGGDATSRTSQHLRSEGVVATARLPFTRRQSCSFGGTYDRETDTVEVEEYQFAELFEAGGRERALAAGILYELALEKRRASRGNGVGVEIELFGHSQDTSSDCPDKYADHHRLTLSDYPRPLVVDVALVQLIPNSKAVEHPEHQYSDSHFVVYHDYLRGGGALNYSTEEGREMLGWTMPRPTGKTRTVSGLKLRVACDSAFLSPLAETVSLEQLALYGLVRKMCGAGFDSGLQSSGSKVEAVLPWLEMLPQDLQLAKKELPCNNEHCRWYPVGDPNQCGACADCLSVTRLLLQKVLDLFLDRPVALIIPEISVPSGYALSGKGPPLCTPVRRD